MKTITFDDYANKYESIHLERQNGILGMRLHTHVESLVFNKTIHDRLGWLFRYSGDLDLSRRAGILDW